MDGAFHVKVFLGAHNLHEDDGNQVLMASNEFATHEKWSSTTLENDVAGIKLPEPVTLSKAANIIF